jgi:hypothetical protein
VAWVDDGEGDATGRVLGGNQGKDIKSIFIESWSGVLAQQQK